MTRYDRRLPVYAALGAVAALAPWIVCNDLLMFLFGILWQPLVVSVLLVIALTRKRHRILSLLSTTVAFAIAYSILYSNRELLNIGVRWAMTAPEFKAKLRGEFSGNPNRLAHVEWDGWGFAGAETTEYVVFDPNASLAKASALGEHRSRGIPCQFARARMLESSYYSVTFYANSDWEHCEE